MENFNILKLDITYKTARNMKTYFLTLFVIVLLTGNSCQETIDIEKEKAAIIKVLYEEGEVYAAYDMKRLSALNVKDELDTRLAGTKIKKRS